MKNIILVSFVLLSSCVLLDAASFGSQWRPTNWTDQEIEKGYKLVGDILYPYKEMQVIHVLMPKEITKFKFFIYF